MKFNFSQREKFLFGATFLAMSVGMLYAGIYLPIHNQSVSLRERIDLAETQLQKTERTIYRGKFTQEEYQTLLEYFKQSSSDEQEMSSMLSQIESAARGIDMRIVDMKPRRPKLNDLYNQFLINLEIDGELVSVTEFIHKLQSSPYLFHIDEMRLNKPSPQMPELKCQVTLSKILIR